MSPPTLKRFWGAFVDFDFRGVFLDGFSPKSRLQLVLYRAATTPTESIAALKKQRVWGNHIPWKMSWEFWAREIPKGE